MELQELTEVHRSLLRWVAIGLQLQQGHVQALFAQFVVLEELVPGDLPAGGVGLAAVQLGNTGVEHLVETNGPSVAMPGGLVATGIARH
ncbi:hypothetical protein D9M70_570980 [compost metagenome]